MILYTAPLLSAAECRVLIDTFESKVGSSAERDFSEQPVLRWPFAGEHERAFGLVEWCGVYAQKIVQEEIEREPFRDWDVETIIMTRMGQGGWHEPHADNCRREGDKWVPNHTPHRTHTAIVYLNHDFAGGQLYFPQHQVEVHPTAGNIVIFPADGKHEHGVRRVSSGRRYSLAMWLKAA